ncbi:MAG: universal stress protein [Myxacorys chilensis ATA2-1-KO14]|jgi:nucleotide-binding universal stress UspA family protein|nr:universal stress protein [Myxacorys chilensis ATA2-1-KO14]
MLNTILIALDIHADAAVSPESRSALTASESRPTSLHQRLAEPTTTNALSDQLLETLQHLQLQPSTKVVLSHIVPAIESEVEISADRPQADLENFPYAQIEKQLQAYQQQLPYESDIEIVTGDPIEEILRLANIYRVDLIIIGSRGLTGMQRIVLGSVSSQIVADAPCSVWVVKGMRDEG